MRLRMSFRVALAAVLLASALAATPSTIDAATRRPAGLPELPGPRNGDPDLPEWTTQAGHPGQGEHGAGATSAHVTLWSYLRALFAHHEV